MEQKPVLALRKVPAFILSSVSLCGMVQSKKLLTYELWVHVTLVPHGLDVILDLSLLVFHVFFRWPHMREILKRPLYLPCLLAIYESIGFTKYSFKTFPFYYKSPPHIVGSFLPSSLPLSLPSSISKYI